MITLDIYELEELHDVILTRLDDSLLPALVKANRTGELSNLLSLLGLSNLLGEEERFTAMPTRVIVLGSSTVKEDKLRSLVRKFNLNPDDFEFVLGYNELKHFNFSKLRDTYVYKAILAGPMPHSTPGKADCSSFITEVKNHPEQYPQLIELRDSNELKITNNSFGQALSRLAA